MLEIQRLGKRLVSFRRLEPRPLADAYELIDFIINSPEAFFGEIGEDLFLIGTQVALSSTGPVAQALAVDREGAGVVIVLDSPQHGSPLFNGMAAAGRLALWESKDFYARLTTTESRRLQEFLGDHHARLNRSQRMLLVAESFLDDLLTAAAWLKSRYGIDIVCIEVALGMEPASGEEFLYVSESRKQGGEPSEAAASDADPATPATTEPERRKHQRDPRPADASVRVEYAGHLMPAAMRDYSAGGVGLVLQHPLPIGSHVRVQASLQAPDGPLRLNRSGRVQYCRLVNQNFHLGVAFASPPRSAAGAGQA